MTNFEWGDGVKGSMRVAGMKLEYQCHGPPPEEMPIIVMLHEGLGCVELWRDFPRQICDATGYGIFVYSRPGYGKSDSQELPWELDYMTSHALNILPKVLDRINLKKFLVIQYLY